ncbi:hypothetical protein LINPERHAP1_LOCUS27092 [Linum perenne]
MIALLVLLILFSSSFDKNEMLLVVEGARVGKVMMNIEEHKTLVAVRKNGRSVWGRSSATNRPALDQARTDLFLGSFPKGLILV